MADQRRIVLLAGEASPRDIRLRDLPQADVVTTTIYLQAGESPSTTIVLRNPAEAPAVVGSVTLAPSSGAVEVAGNVPAIALAVAPAAGAVSVAGNVPTVDYPPVEEQPAGGGNSAWYRRLREDDVLPPLERERVLRPASAAGVVVRGYAPTLRRSVRIAEDIEFDIPDEVLAMALELLEEWETA
jgi:hypothetical protein